MVKARMVCKSITVEGYRSNQDLEDTIDVSSQTVILEPVYSEHKDDPNYTFSQYTPSGQVRLVITNKEAYEYFKPGKVYDVDFREIGGKA